MTNQIIFFTIITLFYFIPGVIILIAGSMVFFKSFFSDIKKDNVSLVSISDCILCIITAVIPVLNLFACINIINKFNIIKKLSIRIETILDYQPHVSKIVKRKN